VQAGRAAPRVGGERVEIRRLALALVDRAQLPGAERAVVASGTSVSRIGRSASVAGIGFTSPRIPLIAAVTRDRPAATRFVPVDT